MPHNHYQVYHNQFTDYEDLGWLGQYWAERIAELERDEPMGDMGWKHEMVDADVALQIVDSRAVPWSRALAMRYQQDKINGKVNH